mmetsp:Transcript_4239/g.10766  ORF Transcript_4239/g.10766 Transcript_4239/m.10766 type:complete len:202 (+) Transcript_4239:288-893(+)
MLWSLIAWPAETPTEISVCESIMDSTEKSKTSCSARIMIVFSVTPPRVSTPRKSSSILSLASFIAATPAFGLGWTLTGCGAQPPVRASGKFIKPTPVPNLIVSVVCTGGLVPAQHGFFTPKYWTSSSGMVPMGCEAYGLQYPDGFIFRPCGFQMQSRTLMDGCSFSNFLRHAIRSLTAFWFLVDTSFIHLSVNMNSGIVAR